MAVPLGVVTTTFPDAPAPITAAMDVEETTLKDVAGVPPKLTAVAPVKLAPVMITVVSVDPVVGVKDAIVGAGGGGAI